MEIFQRCPVCKEIVIFSRNSEYYKFKTRFGFWAERLLHKKCFEKIIKEIKSNQKGVHL